MAHVLRLADVSQATTVDLLSGTMQLVDQSWITQTAGEQYDYNYTPFGAVPSFKHFQPVQETMDLVGSAASATVRSGVNAIEDMLEGARLYHSNDIHANSYWLEWNADGESAKRALIYSGALQYPVLCGINHFVSNDKLMARLTMTRHPLWENTSSTTITSNGVSYSGGTWQITGVTGTVPARMRFFSVDYGGGQDVTELWIGIRPNYEGRSGFLPAWDATSGTASTDTSSGSGAMYTTFASDTTLVKRFDISVDQVIGSNYHHMTGKYLVLGRVRCEATDTVVGIQMAAGYVDSGIRQPSAERFIDGRSKWHLMELGYVNIPSGIHYYGQTVTAAQKFAIEIRAEWIEGTKGLYVDYLYLIPSEHMVYIDKANIANNNPLKVVTRANDTTLVEAWWGAYPAATENSTLDWYLPVGSSVLVLAGQKLYSEAYTPHDATATADLEITYYPRWRSYRDS